jgi:hypothetical protein
VRTALFLALALTLVGCASFRPPWPEGASAALAAIETRTPEAPTVRVDYRITASGTSTADLAGTLGLGRFDRTLLIANGTFGGAPQRLVLTAEKNALRGLHADSVAFAAPQLPFASTAPTRPMSRSGWIERYAVWSLREPSPRVDRYQSLASVR